jgi:hypothetical protein
MTRTIVVVMTAGRDSLEGVNVFCPECSRIAARVEGALAPWCGWCRCWFCGRRCARRHTCRGRRAVHALLAAVEVGVDDS